MARAEPQPAPAERARPRFRRRGGGAGPALRVDLGPSWSAPAPEVRRFPRPGPPSLRLPPGAPAGPLSDAEAMVLDIETLGLRAAACCPSWSAWGSTGTVPGDRPIPARRPRRRGPDAGCRGRPCRDLAVLLTYNGRRFDIPVLRARCVINRRPVDAISPAIHCDLLDRCDGSSASASCVHPPPGRVSLLGLVREDDVPVRRRRPASGRADGPPSVLRVSSATTS